MTVAALQRGELSVDQAAAIARHAPAYADAEARGFAATMTVAQLSRVCRAYPHFETPSEEPETQWRPEKESMTMGFDEDGTWRLAARLDADRGAVVDGALRHHHDRLIAAHHGDGPFPTVRDALVRMAEHSVTGDDDRRGAAGGVGGPARRRDHRHRPSASGSRPGSRSWRAW